jgi:hypothetical protein
LTLKEEEWVLDRCFFPCNSFLGRSISKHLREFHGEKPGCAGLDESVSRRKFLTNTPGDAGLTFWIPVLAEDPKEAKATGKGIDPQPIAGGASPFYQQKLHWQASTNHRKSQTSRASLD